MRGLPRDPRNLKERAMDAFWDELTARGWQKLRLSTIIRATGCSRSGFYHHFRGKLDLFLMAYARHSESTRRSLDAGLLSGQDVEAIVKADVLATLASAKSELIIPALLEVFVEASRDPKLRKLIARDFSTKGDACTRLFQDGQRRGQLRKDVAAETMFGSLYAAIFGHYLLHFALGDPRPLHQTLRAQLDLCFQGLLARPKRASA